MLCAMWAGVGRTNPLPGGPDAAGSEVASRYAGILTLRLQNSLRLLLREPERILEVGLKQPPKELEATRAELRRLFAGSRVTALQVAPRAPEAVAAGRFGDVRVDLADLTLMGLRLSQAHFTLEGLVVDPGRLLGDGQLAVQALDSIGMAFRVEEQALQGMSDAYRISVYPGRFVVRGRRRLLVLPLGFRASGRLDFDEVGRILFFDRSMSLNGLPLPGLFRSALRRHINPIFDLQSYLGTAAAVVSIRFLGIAHLPGALELTARAWVALAGDEAPREPPPGGASHKTSGSG